ncbi:hemin uptake protein HemP, putative [Geobacter metallireducens GS-15]|uniref:Hemin uptake protein HemP, putative n=1 Tax=Geobacter metallireducens (strain ATCC 53774 / DSM 7210 / GS-15) TaxID=269799 RepID=J9JEN5_GEOMG|nr:hemin uptake protein HemP, putative [Geobacter metallireducens GS-15]
MHTFQQTRTHINIQAGGNGAMPVKCITAAELMDGEIEIIIVHAGEQYRLRITANNKLILTK